MQQNRVPWWNQHAGTRYELESQEQMLCVRTKTREPATNSLVIRTGIAERAVDEIPIEQRAMFDRIRRLGDVSEFLYYGYLVRNTG